MLLLVLLWMLMMLLWVMMNNRIGNVNMSRCRRGRGVDHASGGAVVAAVVAAAVVATVIAAADGSTVVVPSVRGWHQP